MFCPNCGSENVDGAKVCTSCGAELTSNGKTEQNPAQQAPLASLTGKLKNSGGTVAKIAVAAVAVILLILIIAGISGGRSGDYTFLEQSVTVLSNDDETTVFVNGKAIKKTIDGSAAQLFSSLDGKVSLFLAEHDEVKLYTLRNKTLTEVPDVEAWNSIVVAPTGAAIAYTEKSVDGETTLSLYNVAKKKATEIKASDGLLICTAISPDGKTLAYTLTEDGDTVGYFYNGKESVKLGTNVRVFGLSNGGKYIYGINTGDEDSSEYAINLYTKKGDKKSKIGEVSSSNPAVTFNEDHTQFLYSCDGKTFISVKGKEGERFFMKSGVTPILPNDCRTNSDILTSESGAVTYPVDSFYNLFYYSEDAIYQVKKNYDKKEKMASKVGSRSEITLTEDGERIFYMSENSDIKMIKTSWGEKALEKVVTVAEDVDDYVITSDYDRVYYVDGDDLYSVKETGKSKKRITDEVRGTSLYMGKGDVLFFNKDDDLYACSNGKSAKLALPNATAYRYAGCGYYFFKSDDAVHCATGSKKPKKVFTLD